MKNLITTLMVSCAVLATATTALAQDVVPAEPVTQPSLDNSCAVELWVVKRYDVETTSGVGAAAFGIVGALIEAAANKEGDALKKSEMMEIIPPEYIKEVFLSTDLTTRLNRDSVLVNYHELSEDDKEAGTLISAKNRSTTNVSSCYYEVFVKKLWVYQYMGMKSLMLDFKIKKFSDQTVSKNQG